MRSATIIPLDYTVEGKPTRKEHSIVFMSQEWEELVDLLAVPVQFMKTMQQRWEQDFPGILGAPPIDWDLMSPVNASLKCGYETRHTALTMLAALGLSADGPKANIPPQEKSNIDPFLHGLVLTLMEQLSGGGFYAEFAPRTSALSITYFPPTKFCRQIAKSLLCPTDPAPPGRMNKGLTKATLGLLGPCPTAGTAHFDIGTQQDDRAKFIVDHLENSVRTCQLLNMGQEDYPGHWDEELALVRMDFVAERNSISVKDAIRAKREKPFNILDSTDAIFIKIAADTHNNSVALPDADLPLVLTTLMPTMTVEGLSAPADLSVCGQLQTTETATSYLAGDLTLKDYVPPVPTPPTGS